MVLPFFRKARSGVTDANSINWIFWTIVSWSLLIWKLPTTRYHLERFIITVSAILLWYLNVAQSFAMKDHLDRIIMTVGKGIRSWRFESIDVDRLLIANFLNHGSLELPTAFDSYYNVINSFYRAFVRVSFWCCSKVDKTTSVRYFKDMFEPLHSYFPKAKYREYVKGVFRDHYLF